ncbi:MerR family transcriptional regulator [Streptomyces anulatus]|uniref:MerR family transcriptional regulator n=1 Tax=Streptomyces TaxID=1883 RepID=UPI00093DADA3|nr:MerR family transcriptional regulator [Streptomyces sp. TSRI0395]OKI76075.1 MerR family transcriptional regulator [Streptomyces sp. TSRI0395]
MRIGELSRRSGVPVPTIKYYLREGLLSAGELTSPNQAHYSPGHERRLRLIRALLDVGGLSLAAIGEVLEAMDDPEQPVHKVLGVAADGVTPAGEEGAGPELEDAREEVAALLRRRDWQADERGPAAESLAGVLSALRRAGHGGYIDLLDVYADAAEPVARADLDYVQRRVAREDLVESVVVGTVLGEAMFGALRRLAHIDVSFRRFESPQYLSGPVEREGSGTEDGGADGDERGSGEDRKGGGGAGTGGPEAGPPDA